MTAPLNTFQPELSALTTWTRRNVGELLSLERDADGSSQNRRVQINGNGAVFGSQLIGRSLYAERDRQAQLRYGMRIDHALPESIPLHQSALGFMSEQS